MRVFLSDEVLDEDFVEIERIVLDEWASIHIEAHSNGNPLAGFYCASHLLLYYMPFIYVQKSQLILFVILASDIGTEFLDPSKLRNHNYTRGSIGGAKSSNIKTSCRMALVNWPRQRPTRTGFRCRILAMKCCRYANHG